MLQYIYQLKTRRIYMTKGNFIFSQISNENGQDKMAMYFDVGGDVVEIKMANADYIENKLSEFGVKDLETLDEHLTKNPEQEVYEYDYTDKKGKRHNGFTLDKPFPTPSEAKKAIVAGKVKEVVDNGSKIAVIVELEKGGEFTVVRGYSVFDEKSKRMFALKAKKDRLLDMLGVSQFKELNGQEITFVRQKAGSNFYYDAENDEE